MKSIVTLDEVNQSDLLLAGGKGANLGALVQAGMPVPPGFCITTAGYRGFVTANGLDAKIQEQVTRIHPDDPLELDAAAEAIRRLFELGRLPAEMAGEIQAAYRILSGGTPAAVAVRSSATAEDLPDLSFAGQQDTYLNIIGEEELLSAVVRCWSSLWTARAIGYRARNRIDQTEVALAVVVQRMVQSEVAGVLFTANPLTGKRSETVIDATFGLGEALVSGMVEPDHYVVAGGLNTHAARILEKTLGSKGYAVHGLEMGGTRVREEPGAAALQALPDAQILALANLGMQAENYFKAPQDLEWAWAGGRLYVLQSRAITSLYPLPAGTTGNPLKILFSFATWQGMLQPITPVGQDSFTGLVVGMGRIFGSQVSIRDQDALLEAGGRLFVNLTDLVRTPTGRTIASTFINAVDPISAGILEELLKDPRFGLDEEKMSLSTRLRLVRGLAPVIAGVFYNLLWPARGRARLNAKIDQFISNARQNTLSQSKIGPDISAMITAIQSIPNNSPTYLLSYLLPGIISGQAPLQILFGLAAPLEDGARLVFELTRGMPHNVTTEMDLKLWAVSRTILSDPLSNRHFREETAVVLSKEYQNRRLPPVAQDALAGFFQVYGMRAVAEIDIYRPRWREDPQHIFQVVKSYLEMDENAPSPESLFRGGAEKARLAGEALVLGLRGTRFGLIKAYLARFLISRTRELGGLRETPKFTIVRMLGEAREALLIAGDSLAAQGKLANRDDIFFLHLWEISALAAGEAPGVQDTIIQRRREYEREMNRRLIPRILLSDGTAYYDSAGPVAGETQDILAGSPVSAGVVEGTVRVILDPHGTRLLPGEILVCPATDPAWTPLFLAAGGLVMEVGGMITHGSVVAREYGIPAVVGVRQATTRLKTGQRVRVDGTLGRVQILE